MTTPAGCDPKLGTPAQFAESKCRCDGLAARIYTADRADVAALADRIIACAVALGGTPSGRIGSATDTPIDHGSRKH